MPNHQRKMTKHVEYDATCSECKATYPTRRSDSRTCGPTCRRARARRVAVCPSCASADTTLSQRVSFGPGQRPPRWSCHACRARWTPDDHPALERAAAEPSGLLTGDPAWDADDADDW